MFKRIIKVVEKAIINIADDMMKVMIVTRG